MNIFEVIKIRCRYKEEMVLWEYDLRQDCHKKLYSAYLNKRVRASSFLNISRVIDVNYDLKKIGEIRRRISVKNKINMR
jgi:hypothetical protein